ncbi:MAG: YidC/Oxa1 family membrane protein insertase [Selenomonadaceae bacterium]|nr:YidC/Oxa1 family membrane protein insertase [Selenomonadaceae bacterium]
MSVFSPITDLFTAVLNALYSVLEKFGVGSYGLAIIILTVIIKIILYPLTAKQIKSMKAMQEIAPKMKKLQEKFKDNPQLLQQKMIQLYQDAGVNPMAGCLPMLIQMPILMAMYYTFFSFDYGGGAPSFLWVPNLSETDPTYILPLIAAGTTFLMQKISTVEMNQQTKIMMIFFPLFMGFISLNLPAGLVLYWATQNVVQIVQQLLIYRNIDANSEKGTA